MQGIKILNQPEKVNTLEWAFEHIGCDALVEKDDSCTTMTILAYALDNKSNENLYELLKKYECSIIFKNTDENEVNSID